MDDEHELSEEAGRAAPVVVPITYVIDLHNGLRLQALLPNSSPGRAKFFEVGDAVAAAWPAEAGVVLTE